MSLRVSEDVIISALKESKRLERKNKFQEALDAIEKVASDANNFTLESSIEITEQIANLCNKLVTETESPVLCLRRAEQVLTDWLVASKKLNLKESTFRLLLLTFNNWATYHQAMKNYHMALSYLMRGIKIIEDNQAYEPDSLQFIAKTRLNISALYSELRRYKEAINHAELALSTLQVEIKHRLDGTPISMLSKKDKYKLETMITTYVIAFYNIGVAEESLGHRKAMIQAYKNSVNIGSQFLTDENTVLQMAKRAYEESQIIKPETRKALHVRPMSSREFISALDQHKAQLKEPFEFKTSLAPSETQDHSDKLQSNLSLPSLMLPNVHKAERYYSQDQLKKLQKKLTEDPTHRFVSADQYFYSKISKNLNIASDVKHMRPLSTQGAMGVWEKEKEDKRKISDLRLRKHHRHIIPNLSSDHITHRIEKLKQEDEDKLRRQEIKMKSKMKTRVYKNLMEALNKNNRRIVPNQRLFFKPLIRNEFDRRETVKMGLDVEEKPKKIGFKMANDEIENIMDRIHDEIKAIDIEKGVSKEKIIEKFEESAFDSRLAQSILYKKQSDKECFQNVIYVKSPSSPSIFSSEKIVNSVKLAVNRNSSRPLTALQKSG